MIGDLKKGERLEEAHEEYKHHDSIRVQLSRFSGTSSSGRTVISNNNEERDSVPRKVVKGKGSSTKARSARIENLVETTNADSSFDITEQKVPVYVSLSHEEEDPMASFYLKYRTIGIVETIPYRHMLMPTRSTNGSGCSGAENHHTSSRDYIILRWRGDRCRERKTQGVFA